MDVDAKRKAGRERARNNGPNFRVRIFYQDICEVKAFVRNMRDDSHNRAIIVRGNAGGNEVRFARWALSLKFAIISTRLPHLHISETAA